MPSKRKNSGVLDWFADFSVHSVLLHPFTMFLAVTIVLLIGSSALWKQHKSQITKDQFRLTVDKIDVNSQPDWIRSDLRKAVLDGSRLDDYSLLDTDVVNKVRDAFKVNPWIEKVVRVQKNASNVEVEVKYRKPVAMVEFGNKHLLPVDRHGVILDGSEFKTSQVGDFLRISVHQPVGGQIVTGQPWPDARVIAAAQVAAKWDNRWNKIGLFRIVNHSPPTMKADEVGLFEIWTLKGTKLVWGSAIGNEQAGEVAAEVKIKAILDDVEQNGQLDARDVQFLDVRGGRVKAVKSKMRQVSSPRRVEPVE